MRRVCIWLDDFRDPNLPIWRGVVERITPDTEVVLWVKSYEEFVELFPKVVEENTLVGVFFDNDLGEEKEGRHAFSWMEAFVHEHGVGPFSLYAQTVNSAARVELALGFQALQRFWSASM